MRKIVISKRIISPSIFFRTMRRSTEQSSKLLRISLERPIPICPPHVRNKSVFSQMAEESQKVNVHGENYQMSSVFINSFFSAIPRDKPQHHYGLLTEREKTVYLSTFTSSSSVPSEQGNIPTVLLDQKKRADGSSGVQYMAERKLNPTQILLTDVSSASIDPDILKKALYQTVESIITNKI